MRSSPFVNQTQLVRGVSQVRREFTRVMNFQRSRLRQIQVVHCRWPVLTLPGALAFFVHEASALVRLCGFEPGQIYVPLWVPWHGFWQNRGSLRQVLRHEFGHGLIHYYPELDDHVFRRAFGGSYWQAAPAAGPPEEFISAYAMTNPAEDFCETFAEFVRQRGRLPNSLRQPRLRQKWRFIARVLRKL